MSQHLLIRLGIIIISISISMGCEIGELRELRFNPIFDNGLKLTDELTDPNITSHNSQIVVDPPPNPHLLLVTQPLNYSLSTNPLTCARGTVAASRVMFIGRGPAYFTYHYASSRIYQP